MLAIFVLASCTATVEQIPTSTPVLASTSTEALAPTVIPTKIPEATPTEVDYSVHPLILKDESVLVDSRINCIVDNVIRDPVSTWSEWVTGLKYDGFTRVRISLNSLEGSTVDFSYAAVEEQLPDDYVDLFRQMKALGIKTRYSLSFWDMAYRQNHPTINKNRLSTEDETKRYLNYVRMVATSLKGLVVGYELWNEPNVNVDYQRIAPEDYIRVAKRAIPLIREIDPQAKIVLISTGYRTENGREYTKKILQSNVVSLADAISIHAVNNDASPIFLSEYYYGYDEMWKNIKQIAEANGFQGEYIADELNYRSDYSINVLSTEEGDGLHPYKPEIAAKYIGRMIAINLGLDISVGTSGTNAYKRPIEGNMIRNMAYLFDGLHANSFPVTVKSESEHIRYYTFVDEHGNKYIAIWDDGEAKVTSDNFTGSIVVEDTSAISVIAMDPFNSTMQNIKFSNVENRVLLDEIDITDFPTIYKIEIQ